MDDTLEQFVEKIQNMTADQLKYSKGNLAVVMEVVEHCREIKNSIRLFKYVFLNKLYFHFIESVFLLFYLNFIYNIS